MTVCFNVLRQVCLALNEVTLSNSHILFSINKIFRVRHYWEGEVRIVGIFAEGRHGGCPRLGVWKILREEFLQLVLWQLEGEGGPEGVQQERVDWGGAGRHLLLPLAQPADGVEQIPLRAPQITRHYPQYTIRKEALKLHFASFLHFTRDAR